MRRAVVAGALTLAVGSIWFALHTARAEWVFTRALGYGVRASVDTPGRLGAYERAGDLDGGEFAYAFRAGQLRLTRGAAAEGGSRTVHLERAVGHLRRAVSLHPFDPRPRMALSNTLGLTGDLVGAYRETRRSVAVGPRHPSALTRAARVFVRRWESTRDPADLLRALDAAEICLRMGERIAAGYLSRSLRRRGIAAAFDVAESAAERPALLRVGADLIRDRFPVEAEALLDQADRIDGGEGDRT